MIGFNWTCPGILATEVTRGSPKGEEKFKEAVILKTTGITRPVDHLGRIVLPKELRDTFDIHTNDRMEVFTEGNDIILRKFERGCIFCGEMIDTTSFRGKRICSGCKKELKSSIPQHETI